LVGAAVGGVTGAALALLSKSPPIAFIGLRAKLMAAFSLLAVMILWGSSYWIYDYAVNTALDDITEEIKTLLRVAAAGIDGDEVAALYRADGLTDDARYQDQLRWLETVRGESPYTLYTFVRADESGKIAFVVDTLALDGPTVEARYRETRSLPDDSLMWQGFITTTVSTVEKFSLSALLSEITWQGLGDETANVDAPQDGRGAWISGYAPIQNARGESVAVIGIDLPAARTSEMQVDVFTPVRRVFGELFIPMLIVVFLISRAITRPLVAVTKAARRIGEGDYDLDLSTIHQVRFRNEISELAEAIEESARAHISERNLRQQVEKLKIQINDVKRRQQVEAIVEDEFFQDLQARANEIRARRRGKHTTADDQET
jgi:methyl-accepting chemotaxis protein